MVVEPIFTTDEPLVCVKEPVLRSICCAWLGERDDGRVGGVCCRCARSKAFGEISGIAVAGIAVGLDFEAGIEFTVDGIVAAHLNL